MVSGDCRPTQDHFNNCEQPLTFWMKKGRVNLMAVAYDLVPKILVSMKGRTLGSCSMLYTWAPSTQATPTSNRSHPLTQAHTWINEQVESVNSLPGQPNVLHAKLLLRSNLTGE